MIDTSKYNLVKIDENRYDDTNVFSQTFHDEDNHVSYVRVTWDPDKMSWNTIDFLNLASKLLNNMLPGICKLEITDNSYECLMFDDDDIRYHMAKEVNPIVNKTLSEVVDDLDKILLEVDDREEAYEKVISTTVDRLTNNEELKSKIKEVYKDYLNKEL